MKLWLVSSGLILFFLAVKASEDDFAFEQERNPPLRRLWGISDTMAFVGHLFQFKIPENAFVGEVSRYKAYSENSAALPSWLHLEEKSGIMEGVPTDEDLGEHYITVKAFDQNMRDFAKDVFLLEVLMGSDTHPLYLPETCKQHEEKTELTLVLDIDYNHLRPRERISLIKTVAGFFSLNHNAVSINNLDDKDEMLSDSLIAAGPGNIRRKQAESSTILQWAVGCDGNLWSKYVPLLEMVKTSAKSGTLADLLQYGIIGWRIGHNDDGRRRRGISGSGEAGVDDEGSEIAPDRRVIIDNPSTPIFSVGPTLSPSESSHEHRHGHTVRGGHNIDFTVPVDSIMPTPVPSDRPSILYGIISESIMPTSVSSIVPSSSSTSIPTWDPSPSTDTSSSSMDLDTTLEEDLPTPPIPELTSQDTVKETIENYPPVINRRFARLSVTAGKVLEEVIPDDIFSDQEDGNTRNLNLSLKTPEGGLILDNMWVQLNKENQTIYALPLEEHVSKWSFQLEAVDSSGLSAVEDVEIVVQQHKGSRTVNHLITAEITGHPSGRTLDWELSLLQRIRLSMKDADTKHITVISANTTSHPVTFTWTNDSLPRNDCPKVEIEALVKVLNSQEGLLGSFKDGLRVNKVTWTGIGQCELIQPNETPPLPWNFPPVPRNPVDHINATVGQLLVYPVPEDSFYDPEDGSTPRLQLTLLTMDRQPIAPHNWLQFDSKNQEFFGIPMSANVGQTEYQLICKDSGGLSAQDGLVVVVHSAPKVMYNVEFSMSLGIDYNNFVKNPSAQRTFVERLAKLFGDPNTNSIVISGIAPGSTIITWHNKSLPTKSCPNAEIRQLRQIILNDDERVTPQVSMVLGPEYPVLSARLTPTGFCQGALTEVNIVVTEPPSNDITAISHSEQYLIGLIVPAVVVAVMLLCAGLVACLLYRRRRTGKMSVGDEDERQTFRSKGIPVIFQDELDERPEPTNKSPVIMKEEKPPLPPPEYQRGPPLATTALLSDTEDSPYQPPPPFTSSRDTARPKPTPTYRMPPPYVPP